MHACLQYLCSSNTIFEGALRKALADAGISTHSSGAVRQGPVICFFDNIDQSLCERVQEFSGGDVERVLAIASTDAALTHAGTWQLLQAGASELFSWDHSADPVAEIACRLKRWAAVDELVESPAVQTTLVGQSTVWKRCYGGLSNLRTSPTALC